MCFVIFHHWLVWSRLTVLSLSELLMFSYYSERNIFIYVLVIVLDTLNLAAVAVLYSGMVRSVQAVLCTADQPSALFHGVRFVRRRGAVCPCWKQQPSALAELQHWFFTYCRARQVYLLFSISILLFSGSKLMTSKVTSRGFFDFQILVYLYLGVTNSTRLSLPDWRCEQTRPLHKPTIGIKSVNCVYQLQFYNGMLLAS